MTSLPVNAIFFLSLFSISAITSASSTPKPAAEVKIPLMERPAVHRVYADALLALALDLSAEKYGPYKITQQKYETVVGRQLLELEKGEWLSVAVSMPLPLWLEKAQVVHFPIFKGLASYRMFFTHQKKLNELKKVNSFNDLKSQLIGQGRGWSTAKILEDNGFKVMYGPSYNSLFPMLEAGRFQLLMRGIYEIEAEFKVYRKLIPDLAIADNFAVYTYLPSYFFVSKTQPELAQRLEYGLKAANENGQFDKLFERYFKPALALLGNKQREIFYLTNTNITEADFTKDKPYLLQSIIQLEDKRPKLSAYLDELAE